MAAPEPDQPAARFEPLEPPRISAAVETTNGATTGARADTSTDARASANPGARTSAATGLSAALPVTPVAETAPVAKTPQNAVAITYSSNAGAPRVVAKGRGLIAEQIIARAREHGVAVHESKELVALLMQVELDDHIPPALYRAVAELLAWLYHIEAARSAGGKVS